MLFIQKYEEKKVVVLHSEHAAESNPSACPYPAVWAPR